jgi:hypothetical protein
MALGMMTGAAIYITSTRTIPAPLDLGKVDHIQ